MHNRLKINVRQKAQAPLYFQQDGRHVFMNFRNIGIFFDTAAKCQVSEISLSMVIDFSWSLFHGQHTP